MSNSKFSKSILKWFDKHGRKNLPWQINKNPYRVWVSEIMLQQTQVATVIPFYERFMQRFPCVETLANANEDEVLHFWTGLGYYSRARNLHHAAKIINTTFTGTFPSTHHQLIELPGIGRSTAGAILSSAFEKPAAILDGNVKRVFTRFKGILQWPGEQETNKLLWKIAENLLPAQRCADYTQALMDLGATVCRRSKPLCDACPLSKSCIANKKNLQKIIPARKPTKILPVRETNFLILRRGNTVLLEKRPAAGIWGSLWSLPQIDDVGIDSYLKKINLHAEVKYYGKIFRHTFSHFHLDISPIYIDVKTSKKSMRKISDKQNDTENLFWYDLELPQKIGLPAPVKKILLQLCDNITDPHSLELTT